MKILINCSLRKTDLVMMKFCKYQDSTAVLVHAKFHHDQIDKKWYIDKYISIEFEILFTFNLWTKGYFNTKL